ncbi:replication initiation and membrane attachment family protein [Paenisporosarcina sp. TG-14]|uniref:replication initiation and membrane attachment family protein n=1 Tax=Paenisporosarcina sp. TG-14 TaxID=1231057 RepID=UPI0003101CAD|nr:DnaD domain protein [Paenisporosarcina sp. TG-14]
MQLLFKELQPVDSFIIQMPHPLADTDRQLVTMLYKPIIGSDAMSLYCTLWAESDSQITEQLSHYYLMDVLNMSLKKIFDARVALEAIGLMKTWKKDDLDKRMFIYEVVAPLDAASFFSEPILATSLYSVIHEKAYLRVRERFMKKQALQGGYENVSRDLQDVFKSNHDYTKLGHIFDPVQLDQASRPEKFPFYSMDFDFDLLKSGLSEVMIPSNVLTLPVKEMIAKMAFLYSLNAIDMQKVLMMAIDDQNRITEERLKKTAADYYKLSISSKPPRLTQKLKQQNEVDTTEIKLSKDQSLIKYLEETPPLEVLREISKGKEPLPVEVELANELIFIYGFPPAVINVLLQFVLIRAKMKLNKNYVHKIAAHWQRENIQTAEQAIEISRKEHDQYVDWQNTEKTAKTPSYKRKNTQRDEKVPDWFYKAKETRSSRQTVENEVTEDWEEKKQQLLKKLGVTEGQAKTNGTNK